ncbi:MAG TPA: hypothetical protein VFO41_13595 [Alphaproteobacteria bacterium]|nr:hypothetical protein [Alphaproteobacteria bacterium]
MKPILALLLLVFVAGCVAGNGSESNCRVVSTKELYPWIDSSSKRLSCRGD